MVSRRRDCDVAFLASIVCPRCKGSSVIAPPHGSTAPVQQSCEALRRPPQLQKQRAPLPVPDLPPRRHQHLHHATHAMALPPRPPVDKHPPASPRARRVLQPLHMDRNQPMIVGVDISTLAVHLAWLEDGKPQRWHCELGTSKVHVIDRIRAIDIHWPRNGFSLADVTEVAIEFPYSVNRDTNAKLMAVLGAVTRQAPPWARVAWPSSGELRQAIRSPNRKDAAHYQIQYLMRNDAGADQVENWDEHELDALVACIGWTRILEQQDAA